MLGSGLPVGRRMGPIIGVCLMALATARPIFGRFFPMYRVLFPRLSTYLEIDVQRTDY